MSTCAGCGTPTRQSKRGRARRWCSERCRKRACYTGICERCGATTYSGVVVPPTVCDACRKRERHETRHWTPERVIAAIRRYADENGGIPPCAPNLMPRKGESKPAYLPALMICVREFGSWSASVEAAGFPRPMASHCGRDGEDPELCAAIRRRYEAGESGGRLAREYGCSDTAIYHRIRKAGGTMRTPEEAIALRKAA